MDEQRPNPDELLKSIEEAEEKKKAGKLRIFFGYAAGIGKTYNMLRSAQKRKAEGVDVVIGYLEPHARPETTEMAKGMEQIPVKTVAYNSISLKEMDLDAILKRRPKLVLVDEYAHTNAPGGRHEKRYQDVEELLGAGIDVYTTVNVQHIESLCDMVASITGIVVRERIPDYAFDRADEIKLVDAEPQILMNRFLAGKVYRSEQAKRALHHFFTIEKLTALRELALRRTADRVNLLTEQTKKETGRQYYTEEKILVGLSSSPTNKKIIRTAARMAQAFGGRMIALYVEKQRGAKRDIEDEKRLKENMHLAEQLGAKIVTVPGEDVPYILAEYAKNAGVSKIIAGRSLPQRGFFKKASFIDKLTRYAPDIDIYIIPDSSTNTQKEKGPKYREQMRIQSRELVKSAYQTNTILEISQILQNQTDGEEIGKTIVEELSKFLHRSVLFYEVEKGNLKKPCCCLVKGDEEKEVFGEKERTVIEWVAINGKCAGATTDTLREGNVYYLPVHSIDKIYGIVGIKIAKKEGLSALEQNVVTVILCEAATVIEREQLRSGEVEFSQDSHTEAKFSQNSHK